MTAMLLAAWALPRQAMAYGLGVFYGTGSGNSTLRVEGGADSTADIKISGLGVLFDTNLGKDEVFNYRMVMAAGEYGNKDGPYEALVMTHDFGFGLMRTSRARLWLGPEIMITSINEGAAPSGPDLFGFGMGPAVGMNLNITRNFSFTIKGSYISQTMAGRITLGGSRYDVTTKDSFIYAGAALVIRFDERF